MLSSQKLAEVKLQSGIKEYQKGHYEEAMELLMQSLDYYVYGETQYYIGKIFLQQNSLPDAKNFLEKAAEAYNQEFAKGHGADSWIEEYQDLSLNLADVLLRLNEPKSAKGVLQNAQSLYVVNNIGNIKRIEELMERADAMVKLISGVKSEIH